MSEKAKTDGADAKCTGAWCWHDLMTTDVEGAIAFYGDLLGWTVKAVPIGDTTYNMIHADGMGIGGFAPVDPSMGVAPHWIGYVTTDDVDAAARRAASHGGAVEVPAMDIPGVGRFAIVTDPGGARFAPFASAHGAAGETPTAVGPGQFCWNELMADDVPGSCAFYGEVLGWTAREQDMGELGPYHILSSGQVDRAGLMVRPSDAPHGSMWTHFAMVADLDAAFERTGELGGMQFVPPTPIPGHGRFAIIADPQGAVIGLFGT